MALQTRGTDFNAANKETACGLFVPDRVASYPASDWDSRAGWATRGPSEATPQAGSSMTLI
jgi:hypothetical protein